MRQIEDPRPIYNEDDSLAPKGLKKERLIAGTNQSGLIADITIDGMYINGYYLSKEVTNANVRDPIFVTWDDIEKMKAKVTGKKKTVVFEDEPTAEYLESLPVVTLNGLKFYVDGARKERRPVKDPNKVFKYGVG